MVNEHFGSLFLLYETETSAFVKPFIRSVGHGDILLSINCPKFSTGGCNIEK
jgi:hypothetical protein